MRYVFIISYMFIFPIFACETPDINAPHDYNGNTPLHIACLHKNNTETITDLIKRGAKIEVTNKYGSTPLFFACSSKHTVENAKLLLAKGAKVNIKDTKYGETPLHTAVWFGETLACVKLLLEYGADPNAINSEGKTPRQMAEDVELKDQETLDIIRLLKEYETKQATTLKDEE